MTASLRSLLISGNVGQLKDKVTNKWVSYLLSSVHALCCYRSDVADPPLLIYHLHSDIPIAAAMARSERHNHNSGEVKSHSIFNFDPDHSANQLLWAGHHQAAQGVSHLAPQGSGCTDRCSDKACVWHIRTAALQLTGEPKKHIQ